MHFPFSSCCHYWYVTHPHLGPPPRLVVLIPLNCLLQALLKRRTRQPANQIIDLLVSRRMPKNLTRSIPHVVDLSAHWLKEILNHLGNLQHGMVFSSPDVQYLPNDSCSVRMQQRIESFTMILDVKPIPCSGAVTMDSHGLSKKAARHETWDGLLQMLLWTKVVEGPHDYSGNTVGLPVRVHQSISSAFRRSIWTHRIKRMVLIHMLR